MLKIEEYDHKLDELKRKISLLESKMLKLLGDKAPKGKPTDRQNANFDSSNQWAHC